jgi:hypothetical protein
VGSLQRTCPYNHYTYLPVQTSLGAHLESQAIDIQDDERLSGQPTMFDIPPIQLCGEFFLVFFDVRLNSEGVWVFMRWIDGVFVA